MTLRSQHWWLLALAVVGGLAIWSSSLAPAEDGLLAKTDSASGAAVRPIAAIPANGPATENDGWQLALRRDLPGQPAAGDPFQSAKPRTASSKGAAEAAAPALPIAAPAPPPAPPLAPPFRYLGKLERAGKLDIYLDYHGSPLIAHVGDSLNEGWRLDQLNAGQLGFTYLATGEQHTVAIQP
ncbi:hypothetical protein [Chitinimonas naiadis]